MEDLIMKNQTEKIRTETLVAHSVIVVGRLNQSKCNDASSSVLHMLVWKFPRKDFSNIFLWTLMASVYLILLTIHFLLSFSLPQNNTI